MGGCVFFPLWCCQTVYLFYLMCFFSSFVKHFHFQLRFSVGRRWLTDWCSVALWACFSESVSALSSPSLLSFRHYQTKAYFKIFWKRYISLILFFLLQSALSFVSTACFYFPSALPSRFAFCVVHLRGYPFLLHSLLKCNYLDLEKVTTMLLYSPIICNWPKIWSVSAHKR